ncbi:MAG: DUF1573 domain-containing protein [Planctomycetota bacterium]
MSLLARATLLIVCCVLAPSTTPSTSWGQDQAPKQPTGVPKVKAEKVYHDWGSLLRGESHGCVFRFLNEGTAPLRITQVKPSCGCTTQKWTRGEIAPGEYGEVALTIDTAKLERGHQEKMANIFTNDPNQSNVQVKIGGKVLTVFRSEPNILTLSGLHTATKQGHVDLLPGAGRPFEVLNIRPTLKAVRVDRTEVLENGGRVRVFVSANAALPGVKQERLRVTVKTLDGKEHQDDVKVNVKHLERIVLEPKQLRFPGKETAPLFETPAKPVVKQVRIKASTPEVAFKVLRVTVGGPAEELLETELSTVEEGREYLVQVRLARPYSKRVLRGTLHIETDDMTTPLKSLRIFAQFRPPRKTASK